MSRVAGRLNRYGDSLPGSAGVLATGQLAAKAGPMALRGIAMRYRLAEARGPIYIGRGVRLRNPHLIHALGRLLIEDYAEVHGLATNGIVFGDKVSVGTGALIRPSGYYSRDVGDGLVIGDRSSIGPYCFLGCWGQIRIGSDVMLEPGVRVFGDTHLIDDSRRTIKSQGVRKDPVVIGDDCWIGSGATIVGGVTIGCGVVVRAGSVLTHRLPDFVVAARNPARVIRQRHSE